MDDSVVSAPREGPATCLATSAGAAKRPWLLLVLVLVVITAVRLVGLQFSRVDLFFDEAQYWSWAQNLALGYYSKPPLIAWVIFAAEQWCGSSEPCVRAPAPLFYFGTSLITGLIGRALYGERVGVWAAMLTAFTTGTAFSARIISTDVPLLFFWSVALLAYVKLLEAPRWRYALLLGVALGLGLLSKYAMIYFIPAAAVAALWNRRARLALVSAYSWVSLLLAALIVSPHIAWNVSQGFITLIHTGQLVLGEETRLSALRGLEFLAAQFGVSGPIIFGTLLLIVMRPAVGRLDERDRLMVAFAVVPLTLVLCFAVAAKAYANWAATAFISTAVVVAATLVRRDAKHWLTASVAIGIVAQLVLLVGDVIPDRIALPFLASPYPYHPSLGWRSYAQGVGALADRLQVKTIVSDRRAELSALQYYLRGRPLTILWWRTADMPDFNLGRPITDGTAGPLLFVSDCDGIDRVKPYFDKVEPLGYEVTGSYPGGYRAFFAVRLEGIRAPIQTLPPHCLARKTRR